MVVGWLGSSRLASRAAVLDRALAPTLSLQLTLVKSWDAIIVGGGIIGLSLAIALRKQGLRVLIVERGEPGREASHAAAGMLAGSGGEIPAALRVLAEESARIYPEFVHELEDESGVRVDLRDQGTILISSAGEFPEAAERISFEQLQALEPGLAVAGRGRPALHESSGVQSGATQLGSTESWGVFCGVFERAVGGSAGADSGGDQGGASSRGGYFFGQRS